MTSDSASRVTRSKRSLRRSLLLAAAVLAGVTVLRAQETPPATAPATAPAATPAAPDRTASPAGKTAPAGTAEAQAGPAASGPPAATAPTAPAESADAPAPAAGKPGGKVGPTRDRFEPTEKVRADFDVSFPVDI